MGDSTSKNSKKNAIPTKGGGACGPELAEEVTRGSEKSGRAWRWEVVVGHASSAEDRGRLSPPPACVGKKTHRENECLRKKKHILNKNMINMSTKDNQITTMQQFNCTV